MRKEDSGFRIQKISLSRLRGRDGVGASSETRIQNSKFRKISPHLTSPRKREEEYSQQPANKGHQPSTINHQPTRGFTLLEMSVVITIIALFVGSFLSVVARNSEDKRIRITQTKMDYIMRKVEDYYYCANTSAYFLPCPADPSKTFSSPTAPTFGVSIGVGTPTANNCNGSGSGVATGQVETGGGNIRAGGVPTGSLGIAPSYAFDGWNRRFTYVVDARVANNTGFGTITTSGAGTDAYITINDAAGGTLAKAVVLVVSHGANGFGAWTYAGSTTRITTALSALGNPSNNSPDEENQDFDSNATFSAASPNKANLGSYSDDIIAFRTKWQFKASPANCNDR